MALDTFANFKTAIADQLARGDLTSQIPDCITLFESDASYELFRMRGAEATAILVPSTPASLAITGAANNGSGLIRLAMASTSTLTTGNEATVASVGGTIEANGSWIITVHDGTTVDLQGSTFTNAYVSGGTLTLPQGQVALPADYLGWRRVTWTGSSRVELDYVHPSILQAFYPDTPSDTPQIFTIEGSTLKIRPLSGTPLEFDYFAKTAALSGSLNWLFTNRVDCYWAGTLEQVYAYVKDYDQAGQWRAKKEEIYGKIKMQRFREDGALTVRFMGATP